MQCQLNLRPTLLFLPFQMSRKSRSPSGFGSNWGCHRTYVRLHVVAMRADLHIGSVEGSLLLVTLSRRNLLALLAKLDEPASWRTIVGGYVYCDEELVDGVRLAVRAEPDEPPLRGSRAAGTDAPVDRGCRPPAGGERRRRARRR